MKKLIERFRDLHYRKRIVKWLQINIKLIFRRLIRFLKSEKFKYAISCPPAIVTYVSVALITALCVGSVFFVKYASPFFNSDAGILRRLSLTEYDESVPYLSTLDMLGSSNRIQVTLRTDDENRFNTKGAGLDRGNINLMLTFSDGEQTEYSLNNSNYDNFEAGMTDTFTIILPFGKTPFDITEYRLVAIPDINNKFDSWHCRWARVYFLLGNEPVMLAKESWEDTALFGDGDSAIKQSSLDVVSDTITRYTRANELYTYFLKFKQAGLSDDELASLKADTLEAIGLNSGKVLNLNIETVNIEVQNSILTYHTKGVTIPDRDSLDYDGMMYLDITFYTKLKDGSYTKRYTLDTLGTDDFEMAATSAFRLEMPEGMTVFDISNMTLVADNPHDAWAPRFIRAYIDTDYAEKLEIARLSDTMLTGTYSTPVFYKNLIDTGVELDLTSAFCISDAQRKALEDKNGYSFGDRINNMYYDLQSFYQRQNTFFAEAVDIYTKNAAITAKPTPEPESTPETEVETPAKDEADTPETEVETPDEEVAEEQPPQTEEPNADDTPTVDEAPEVTPEVTPTPAPEVTPDIAPEVTPDEAPEVTPETTPDGTPEVVPETTPDEAPETTPDGTPDEAPETEDGSEVPEGLPVVDDEEDDGSEVPEGLPIVD